jgi:hypothetical protein
MSGGRRDGLSASERTKYRTNGVAVMSIYKPRVVKHPVKVTRGDSKKIVYRAIRNIQQLKNSQTLGTTRINRQCLMVRLDGIYWVEV